MICSSARIDFSLIFFILLSTSFFSFLFFSFYEPHTGLHAESPALYVYNNNNNNNNTRALHGALQHDQRLSGGCGGGGPRLSRGGGAGREIMPRLIGA